jgi:hypothetical protein
MPLYCRKIRACAGTIVPMETPDLSAPFSYSRYREVFR